jgi:hypothetical protein
MESVKVIKQINATTTIEASFEDRSIKDSLKKASWLINLGSVCGKCQGPTTLVAREVKDDNGKLFVFVENTCQVCHHKQMAGEFVSGGLFMKPEWKAPFKGTGDNK